jgi:hypothetical protein
VRFLGHVGVVEPGFGALHPQVAGECRDVVHLNGHERAALGTGRRVGQGAVALPDDGAARSLPGFGAVAAGLRARVA